MTTQPEALRLADLLSDWAKDYATTDFDCDMGDQAAAELRRLYAVNAELLEALKWIDSRCPTMLMAHPLHGIHKEMAHDAGACARAAIAKHGGEA